MRVAACRDANPESFIEWVIGNAGPKLEGRPMLGNFCGWVQLRKTLPREHDPLGAE
jgi:hypothetical protein